MRLKVGDRVRMTEELKKGLLINDCAEHVEEFGHCVGVVVGDDGYKSDPAFDVRWEPSGLKYGYCGRWLERVSE